MEDGTDKRYHWLNFYMHVALEKATFLNLLEFFWGMFMACTAYGE
jgi:hypothetical protein